ncbi:MAG: hypothetical protein KY394_06705 [Actinobacteria bacterium]|nr:hypothetical protein [Actinomycetota bacterium]
MELSSDPPPTGLIVVPGPDGEWPADLEVSCSGGPAFPVSALEEVTDLEAAGREEVEDAIQPFLTNEEGKFWPQKGWQILHETGTEILLVHHDPSGSLAFMTVARAGDGWEWAGAQSGGPCPLRIAVPEGLNTVDWRIDPAAQPVDAEDTKMPLLLSERECVSGQEIGDRLLGPEVVLTEDAVLIAFAATPPEGDGFDCQGNPEMPYLVELSEPIGGREVRSGLELGINLEDFLD